jgi:hypothetical protein
VERPFKRRESARRWGKLPVQLAVPPSPLAHVVSLSSRTPRPSLPKFPPPIPTPVGLARLGFGGFSACPAGFRALGGKLWSAEAGGRAAVSCRREATERRAVRSGPSRKMGFLPAKPLPSCESMCVCCPALRPSSRRPVKRYKKLLAEIFPKTPVSTARLSFSARFLLV